MFDFSKNKAVRLKTARALGVTRSMGGAAARQQGVSTSGAGPNISLESDGRSYDLTPLLADFPLDTENALTIRMYRDIYQYDSVGGPAVDLMSHIPFSEFSLRGLTPAQEKPYLESLERLSARTWLPDVSADYLITGSHTSSTIFDRAKKVFVDSIPHKRENITITQLPFYGEPPVISVKFDQAVTKFFSKQDNARVKDIITRYGQTVVDKITAGSMELDPLSTIHIPRRIGTTSSGVSWLRRLLPIYLYEKNIWKGTLEASSRRQRALLHLIVGDDSWEPKNEDVEALVDMFIEADSDPTGAVVATRNGVQTNEIRDAMSIWKIDDLWNTTLPLKMRSLGVSEALLSGDSSYNCVCGDTFVPTTKGLRTIRSLGDDTQAGFSPLTRQVGSRFGVETTSAWFKNEGLAPVRRLRLESGTMLKGTPKHRVLAVSPEGTLDYVFLSDLTKGHFVALSNKVVVRPASDPLLIKTVAPFPQQVTPELGYFLGVLFSCGSLGHANQIRFTLSNRDVLDRVASFAQQSLSVTVSVLPAPTTGDPARVELVLDGVEELVNWLADLRLIVASGQQPFGPKETTHYKLNFSDPAVIMQSDCDSQAAFFAGFCDMSAEFYTHEKSGRHSMVLSSPKEFSTLLSALLGSFGVLGRNDGNRVKLLPYYASRLWDIIRGYALIDRSKFVQGVLDSRGFPCEWLTAELDRRMTATRDGFRCDSGDILPVGKWYQSLSRRMFMFYCDLDTARVDDLRDDLLAISEELHSKFEILAKEDHTYSKVRSVTDDSNLRMVYDLTIAEGAEPSYVVNTMVGHNTAENALSVFIDQAKTYRSSLVRKIFYDGVFPLISLTNEFFSNEAARKAYSAKKINSKNVSALSTLMGQMKDTSGLVIPTIDWEKQLSPEGDNSYFEMLTALTEKGVPVPLRVLAAATGLSLEKIIQGMDDDLKLRSKISEFNKRIAAITPAASTSEASAGISGLGMALAAASGEPLPTRSAVIAAVGGRSTLLGRDYGEATEIDTVGKTGHLKFVPNQKAANNKVNENIAKAMKNLRAKGKA